MSCPPPLRRLLACGLLGLSLTAGAADTPEDLDAELDAEWGDRKVKTQLADDPRGAFDARMKILEAQRDAGLARCREKSGGNRYCKNYAEELYRKARRALEKEFEGEVEEGASDPRESKGFGRR
jgi:hypothetical protein